MDVVRAILQPQPRCAVHPWRSQHLKFELNQVTGSFKERGARNALQHLSETQRERGVVAASAGNHALALAWHGSQLKVPIHVVMPTVAPLAKVEKCRCGGGTAPAWRLRRSPKCSLFGANVELHGQNIAEAREMALSSSEYEGLTYINGFDDHDIIAGAGTMGLELIRDECAPPMHGCYAASGSGRCCAGPRWTP